MGVTDVDQLAFASLLENEVNIGGHIILSHLVEREVPVLFVVNSEVLVQVGVDGASAVAKPHIGAVLGQDAGCGEFWQVEEPGACDVD